MLKLESLKASEIMHAVENIAPASWRYHIPLGWPTDWPTPQQCIRELAWRAGRFEKAPPPANRIELSLCPEDRQKLAEFIDGFCIFAHRIGNIEGR